MMKCGISGNVPQEPVVCRVSGQIYEKRLAQKYIETSGTDPVSGQPCTVEDLVEISSSAMTTTPLAPTINSIPALLMSLQDEYDSLALEAFSLKKQLVESQQELSTTLYKFDAAVRVVARLTKERDEARVALEELVTSGYGSGRGGEQPMDEDEQQEENTIDVYSVVDKSHKELREGLKGMRDGAPKLNEDLKQVYATKQCSSRVEQVIYIQEAGWFMFGGADGKVFADSAEDGTRVFNTKLDSDITGLCAVGTGSRVVASCSNGSIHVLERTETEYKQTFMKEWGQGSDIFMAAIPNTNYVILCGGQQLVYFDTENGEILDDTIKTTSKAITSVAIHPDASLVALGHQGAISIYSVIKNDDQPLREIQLENSHETVISLNMSNNGYQFVSVGDKNSVAVWDLRKAETEPPQFISHNIQTVRRAVFDLSAKYLCICGASEVIVLPYKKKQFQDAIFDMSKANCSDLVWANVAQQQYLAVVGKRGALTVVA